MICPNCLKGIGMSGKPNGTVLEDGSYFAATPSPDTSDRGKAIVILTDIFGLSLANPLLLADIFAQRLNMDVYVADQFAGSPVAVPSSLKFPDRAWYKRTFFETISFYFRLIFHLPRLYAQRPSVVDPRIKTLIHTLRTEKGYQHIGAIGYCFGGNIAVRLGQKNFFDSALIAHPSNFSDAELNEVKIPVSFACAEDDFAFPEERRNEVEANLRARGVEHEFKVWEGTAHGYASRPNLDWPLVKQGFEGTIEQTVQWFERTL